MVLMTRISLLALLLLTSAANAQSATTKYFGYFAGDTVPSLSSPPSAVSFDEMKDHINLYSIGSFSGYTTPEARVQTQAEYLAKLAAAKAAHVHAIVYAAPFVLQAVRDSTSGNISCWNNDPAAAASWTSLSQAMVDQGYLIPGDPVRSTVVAVYIADEPNGNGCLSDVNGHANPAFVNGVNAVRLDPRTASLPIASILTADFDSFSQGMQLLDWVGYDQYGDSDSKWNSRMADLKSRTPGKKYIVVPGAMQNCSQVVAESTTRYFSAIESDPSVTWIAPFAWFSGLGYNANCLGVRDIPTLRSAYTAEGVKIRNLQCSSSHADQEFCNGTGVTGTDISAALSLLFN